MTYYAIILADGECTTASIFSDPTWWKWLRDDNMPRDGRTSWELAPPPSLAVAYGEPGMTVDVTVGSFENDKAQHIANAVDGPGMEPFGIPVKPPRFSGEDNDAWWASARWSVLTWAAERGHVITEDHIYEGLWY